MKIDIHCHVLGNCKDIKTALKSKDIYYNQDDNANDISKAFIKNLSFNFIKNYVKKQGGIINNQGISSDDYFDLLYELFVQSKELEGLVLLALDANYSFNTRSLQERETDLFISNKYLYEKVVLLNVKLQKDGYLNKKFFFGASVNPNRADWREELDYVCHQTNAVLLKWIPSYMGIDIDRAEHEDFYKMLRENNLPLLCHVGPELSFAEGLNQPDKDRFELLERPLDSDVTVIAAHCASPMFPGNTNELLRFIDFMKKNNSDKEIKLWADTSALAMTYRIPYWSKYVHKFNPKWLIHGSDFPVPIEPIYHAPYFTHDISLSEFNSFINENNPFDLEIKIKRAHGMSDSILGNAEKVLRIK